MNTQPARKLSMGERYADIVAEDRKSVETPSAPAEKSARTAKVTRGFLAPRDYGKRYGFIITAEAYQIGDQDPHFAVTGDIYHKATRTRTGDGTRACGCLHDEALRAWPAIAPIIRLHLSSSTTGEPMHAEANAYYWLAGAAGGLGEQYHGASGSSARTQADCLRILADHLRISLDEAVQITNKVADVYTLTHAAELDKGTRSVESVGTLALADQVKFKQDHENEARRTATNRAKNTLHDFVNAQRDRWQREADEGLALIRKFALEKAARLAARTK